MMKKFNSIIVSKIKIQHYVPRLYLRNFSTKKKSDFFINCFDKPEEKIFSTNIENIGCEKYFYNTSNDTNQSIEKQFGNWESTLKTAYDEIIQLENLKKLSTLKLKSLAMFFIIQYYRTKEARERIRDTVQQVKEKLSKDKLSNELKEQLIDIDSEETIKQMHIASVISMIRNGMKIIPYMKWILLKNKTSMSFWTSDNPVTPYNPIDLSPFGNLGLKNRGIQLYFPLTPYLILLICDPETYELLPSFVLIDDKENVIFQNSLQVFWSTRHIFSINDDFSLANKVLKDFPEYKNVDRKRMSVN